MVHIYKPAAHESIKNSKFGPRSYNVDHFGFSPLTPWRKNPKVLQRTHNSPPPVPVRTHYHRRYVHILVCTDGPATIAAI
jgi:hypothetical protein